MLVDKTGGASADAQQDQEKSTDRRGDQRLRTVFWIAKVTSDCDVGLWRVHNISDRGMMLQTHCDLTPGEPLSIALSDRCSITGTVRWYEKQRCGVEFDEPIDCEEVLAGLAEERRAHQYRAPRLQLNRGATAYCETGLRPVKVCNISQHGIGISHDGRIAEGMKLMLTMENGVERRGIVRWSKDGHSGLQLFEPFPAVDLESRNRF